MNIKTVNKKTIMKKITLLSILILSTYCHAQNIILNHNIGNNIIDQNSNFTCSGGGVNWARVFVLEDFGITGEYTITSGSFAIEGSNGALGDGITVNVYSIDQDFPVSFGNATLLGSSDLIDIPSFTNNTIFTFDFPTEIIVPNNVEIILVETSLAFQNQNVFFGGTSSSNDFSWFKSPYPSCVGEQNEYQTTVDLNRENLNYYITITGNNILGISDHQKKSFTITPNPVKTEMNIKLLNNSKPNNIIVYDLSGKKIMNFKYEKDIDVSMLGAGIYFLTIEIDNENIIKKFIKL
ncbi:MAG: hypothetical protein ACI9M9_002425 [Flavobacteriaceae bacterium]|jgi:hypothetical protein